MFSPQLNEAKYNFLSADINKCGGKGNDIDGVLLRAKIQIYEIKFKRKRENAQIGIGLLKNGRPAPCGVYCY